jgi:hypothetical protein
VGSLWTYDDLLYLATPRAVVSLTDGVFAESLYPIPVEGDDPKISFPAAYQLSKRYILHVVKVTEGETSEYRMSLIDTTQPLTNCVAKVWTEVDGLQLSTGMTCSGIAEVRLDQARAICF